MCGQSKDPRRLTNDVQNNYDYASFQTPPENGAIEHTFVFVTL